MQIRLMQHKAVPCAMHARKFAEASFEHCRRLAIKPLPVPNVMHLTRPVIAFL